MTTTVTVAIGRAQGPAKVMPKPEWKAFRARVLRAVKEWALVVFEGHGTGLYMGVEEESYVIIASIEEPGRAAKLDVLADRLSFLGAFHQQTIALVAGQPLFVGP